MGITGHLKGNISPTVKTEQAALGSKVSLGSLRATQKQVECLLMVETIPSPIQEKIPFFTQPRYKRSSNDIDIKRHSIDQANYQGPHLQQKLKGILPDIICFLLFKKVNLGEQQRKCNIKKTQQALSLKT